MRIQRSLSHTKWECKYHIVSCFVGTRRNLTGQPLWARGYYVSTVGIDEDVIREYIRHQEDEDRRVDQLSLWKYLLNKLG
ncbi:MAG: transposase [Gammaproteobacteria bacterium]